ncbi:MAG: molybdenum cofactor guanylyltransferase, partial [Planctomycetaceae bacterium]
PADNSQSPLGIGGIVLCGGKSSRMGTPKCSLPFGPELMLPRVIRILSTVVSPIIIVAAPEQELPSLVSDRNPFVDVRIVRDQFPHLGPLNGMLHGLTALPAEIDAAYISSCDVPLLKPEFIRAMIAFLGDHDLTIPQEGKFFHPLAGVYRKTLVPKIRELIASDRMRPLFLVEESHSRSVSVSELTIVDPELESLKNINTPADYEAALAAAGFSEIS